MSFSRAIFAIPIVLQFDFLLLGRLHMRTKYSADRAVHTQTGSLDVSV